MNIEFLNLLGSVTALIIYSLCILIFIFRLLKNPGAENLLGIIFIFTAIPLLYLLYSAFVFPRPFIYYIQIILMLAYIIIELFVDYILKVNFRKTRWMVIVYVMFFFGGLGGMIGIASLSGAGWSISAVILFLIMTVLAFIQRVKTGM